MKNNYYNVAIDGVMNINIGFDFKTAYKLAYGRIREAYEMGRESLVEIIGDNDELFRPTCKFDVQFVRDPKFRKNFKYLSVYVNDDWYEGKVIMSDSVRYIPTAIYRTKERIFISTRKGEESGVKPDSSKEV